MDSWTGGMVYRDILECWDISAPLPVLNFPVSIGSRYGRDHQLNMFVILH